jgi:hypothetical protein
LETIVLIIQLAILTRSAGMARVRDKIRPDLNAAFVAIDRNIAHLRIAMQVYSKRAGVVQ